MATSLGNVIRCGVREIELTRGLVTFVDDADYEWLSQWSWCATSEGYAKRGTRNRRLGTQSIILMHRFIMGAPEGTEVDHEDRNPLNNQRHNLRLATGRQNRQNTGIKSNNTSGYKGVYWAKDRNKWRAKIIAGKQIGLGQFDNPEDAARAYNEAALVYFGDFASLNEVE